MKYVVKEIFMFLAIIIATINYDKIEGLKIEILSALFSLTIIIATIILAVRLFLLPYFIANTRKHRNKIPILLVTLTLGWTVIGWVGALIWSTTSNVEEEKPAEKAKFHPIPLKEEYRPAPYSYGIVRSKPVKMPPIKMTWYEVYDTPPEFVAIDFETANPKRTSACAFAVCVVKNDRVVESKSWLIRPEPFYFGKIETKIHGLTEKHVAGQPNFSQIWHEIERYIDGSHIVAHNASFDLSVLRSVLDFYGLDHPLLTYSCTLKMSREAWPELKNHKLNTLAKHLGIEFNHHNAADDAYACAVLANTLFYGKKIMDAA